MVAFHHVKKALLVMPVLLGMHSTIVRADSIWERRDPRYSNLFQDTRARNIGDIIIVTISETTTSNESEQRANDKTNNATGTLTYAGDTSGSFAGGNVTRNGALNFTMADNFRRRFNGSAQATTQRTFTDRMAATVVDILPNGNLVIEGYRSRVVAGEERVLRITGIARPNDIAVGNIIASTALANARISYLGRGPASRSLNQNYLGRVMNAVWPW
jgi:flagellar L-ring protein precursor FlgH